MEIVEGGSLCYRETLRALGICVQNVIQTFRFTSVADSLTLPFLRLLFSSGLYSLDSKSSKWLGLLKSFVRAWFQFRFGFIGVACAD